MDILFLLVFLLSLLSLSAFCLLREIKRQMIYGEIASFTSQWSFSPRFSALLADALTFSCSFGFEGVGVLSKVNECCCSWAQNKSRLRQMLIDATSRRVGVFSKEALVGWYSSSAIRYNLFDGSKSCELFAGDFWRFASLGFPFQLPSCLPWTPIGH